jgi:hypothetical protein
MKDKLVIDGVTYARESTTQINLTLQTNLTLESFCREKWHLSFRDGNLELYYGGNLILHIRKHDGKITPCLCTRTHSDCRYYLDFVQLKEFEEDDE